MEVIKKILTHQIQGVMLHKNMMKYYDFLGLRGYKRMHEYHMYKELMENDSLDRYIINHHDIILTEGHTPNPFEIPQSWTGVNRLQVSNDNRKTYLKEGCKKWVDWERETKKLYEQSYKQLCDIGEISLARKIGQLLDCVDKELKCAEREWIKLNEIDFDLKVISTYEDEMHDCYAKKTKELGIDMN